jgi:hypothetical protein
MASRRASPPSGRISQTSLSAWFMKAIMEPSGETMAP